MTENKSKNPSWRYTAPILLSILVLAASLRIINPGQSPPGLNQDEAANAWNAYCLLRTGKDQAGVSWPIFYMRALGGNRSTLHIYLLLPFQAIGGLNILTARLPSAIGGTLAVLLIYFVSRRLFDRRTALVAAALLALNPWHLQQSRFRIVWQTTSDGARSSARARGAKGVVRHTFTRMLWRNRRWEMVAVPVN